MKYTLIVLSLILNIACNNQSNKSQTMPENSFLRIPQEREILHQGIAVVIIENKASVYNCWVNGHCMNPILSSVSILSDTTIFLDSVSFVTVKSGTTQLLNGFPHSKEIKVHDTLIVKDLITQRIIGI